MMCWSRLVQSSRVNCLIWQRDRNKAQRRKVQIAQLGVGENDLWIATIAIQHKLTLLSTELSTDQAFQRIQAIRYFDVESWV